MDDLDYFMLILILIVISLLRKSRPHVPPVFPNPYEQTRKKRLANKIDVHKLLIQNCEHETINRNDQIGIIRPFL